MILVKNCCKLLSEGWKGYFRDSKFQNLPSGMPPDPPRSLRLQCSVGCPPPPLIHFTLLRHCQAILHLSIVNWGYWLGSPANIKVTNKDVKIYVGRYTTLHNLLFCPHTLRMSYVTNTFLLLVPHFGVNNYCVLCRVKVKKRNNNIQKRTLTSFITIPLY